MLLANECTLEAVYNIPNPKCMLVLAAAGFVRDAAKVHGGGGPCPAVVQHSTIYGNDPVKLSFAR